MRTLNCVCVIGLLLGSSLQAAADNAVKIKTASSNDPGLYSGGGIRGALVDQPDGWLVSPSEAIEFKGEESFYEKRPLRTRAIAPTIDILQPLPTQELKVKAPFAISVKFKNLSDAEINPTTFKVLYGTFKVDITSRLSKFVKISKDGFNLDNAQIPSGKHRLILQIQDEKQRVAERELKVEVE
jgi:hypothetical protein